MIVDKTESLSRHPTKKYQTRELSELKYIVIHNSGTTDGTSESFARYHVKDRDWPGIGYHFVISKNGEIEKTNNQTTISYHVGEQNRESLGICLVGNFDTEKPTQEQYNSLAWLIKELLKAFPTLEIKGHRDFKSTSCPGKNFDFSYLNTLLKHKEKSKYDLLIEDLKALIKKYKED